MIRRLWTIFAAVLLTLAAIPAATAAPHGTDRPVEAALSGTVTWDIGVATPEGCFVVTKTELTGTMTHLGKVTVSMRHCPEGEGYTHGSGLVTAANGDQLMLAYVSPDGEAPWPMTVVGGTGRFADASGTVMLASYDVQGEWDEAEGVPIEPWYWTGTFSGTLSY